MSGLPFVARADAMHLHAALAAHLGPDGATVEAVEAAFLSLPTGLLRFERTGAGVDPGGEALHREAARRALVHIFVREGSGDDIVYVLGEAPDTESLGVAARPAPRRGPPLPPALGARAAGGRARRAKPRGSATSRWRGRCNRSKPSKSSALNQIPLDPEHALRVRLDLTYTGRGGTEETTTIEFRPGDPPLKAVSAVYPALTHPFRVSSRLRLMIAPPGGQGFPTLWPATAGFEPAPNPLAIDLSPARGDVDLVELRALDGVFAFCGAVRCTIESGERQTIARLTAQKPHAWAVLPGRVAASPLRFRLEAEPGRQATRGRW